MKDLLNELLNCASKRNDLIGLEMLERLIERINRGEITEYDIPLINLKSQLESLEKGQLSVDNLLTYILIVIENYEVRRISESLHDEVKRRRDLSARFETEIERAAKRRDGVVLRKLMEDLELLKQLPVTTRQMDQETIDLALNALDLKKQHRKWTYERISTEIFGDPSHAERIKKAVSRTRKAANFQS